MSIMIAEIYEALISAGTPEDKAKAAASVILPKMETEARLDNIEKELAAVKALTQTIAYFYGPVTLGLLIKIAFF